MKLLLSVNSILNLYIYIYITFIIVLNTVSGHTVKMLWEIYLLQINSTRIQTNTKLHDGTVEEKLCRRRQPKALIHRTRDAPSNSNITKLYKSIK